jgi:hypothetical protein
MLLMASAHRFFLGAEPDELARATRADPDAALIVFARARARAREGHACARCSESGAPPGSMRGWWRRRCGRRLQRVRPRGSAIASPGINGPYFKKIQQRLGVRLRTQGRGNLGNGYRALRRHPGAVLIGSDCPGACGPPTCAAARAPQRIRRGTLARRRWRLCADRAATRLAPPVRRHRLGRPDGARQTRARLRRCAGAGRSCSTVWDVDRPEDVARCGAQAAGSQSAPAFLSSA